MEANITSQNKGKKSKTNQKEGVWRDEGEYINVANDERYDARRAKERLLVKEGVDTREPLRRIDR